MEELKNMPSASAGEAPETKKAYTASTSEIILLAPQESLALVDDNRLSPQNRWQIDGWDGIFDTCLASGGQTGTVIFDAENDGWKLPPST